MSLPNCTEVTLVNYPALKDGACREYPASQVDQGKRTPTRYVYHRSLRPTAECFLSSALWKTGITLAKGKAPKVPVAAQAGAGGRHSRGETNCKIRVTRPVRAFIERKTMSVFVLDRRKQPRMPCSKHHVLKAQLMLFRLL